MRNPTRDASPRHRLFGLLVLALLLSGCAGGAAPIEATTYTDEWYLSRQGGRELNFDMQEGGEIHFEVNASAEVKWDLHSHSEEGTTVMHEQGRGQLWNSSFVAPEDDTYSIFVAANGSTTVVQIRVDGPFRIKG